MAYKNIVAVVRTINPENDEVEHEVTRTIDDKERREWLLGVVMYGLLNHKIIEIVNKEDDKEAAST